MRTNSESRGIVQLILSGQHHDPADLPPGKNSVSTEKETRWVQSRSERSAEHKNLLVLPQLEPRLLHTIA
jgi:hypothetical protein